jgi:hypothetical protein
VACFRAGAWLDVPSLPTFEGMDELIGETDGKNNVKIGDIFPINKWTEAYHAHRNAIRVYSLSEYCSEVAVAARKGLESVTGMGILSFTSGAEEIGPDTPPSSLKILPIHPRQHVLEIALSRRRIPQYFLDRAQAILR